MLISFVIPVYNKENAIEPVLESLKAQEGDFEREFIFMDDGSTDRSAEVIHDLMEGIPNVYYHYQDNRGPSHATNRGFKMARGEWVKPLDADDVLLPQATHLLLKAALSTNADVAFGRRTLWTHENIQSALSDLKFRGPQILPLPEDLTMHALQGQVFHTSSAMLAKREILSRIGGCDTRIFVQDYSLLLRLSLNSIWTCLNNHLVFEPLREISLDQRLSGNQAQERHDLNAALYWFFKDHPHLPLPAFQYAAKKATGRAKQFQWNLKTFSHWIRSHNKGLDRLTYLDLMRQSLKAFPKEVIRSPHTHL
jgi:glycosyltransferase involved in cell wall biosynthesis